MSWVSICSMCILQNQIFFIANHGIYRVWLDTHQTSKVIDYNDDPAGVTPYTIRATDSLIVYTDPSTQ